MGGIFHSKNKLALHYLEHCPSPCSCPIRSFREISPVWNSAVRFTASSLTPCCRWCRVAQALIVALHISRMGFDLGQRLPRICLVRLFYIGEITLRHIRSDLREIPSSHQGAVRHSERDSHLAQGMFPLQLRTPSTAETG